MNEQTASRVQLSVSGLSKRFGATQALAGVDLEVESGEVHAVLGENGAGKSTLMKVLSGAYRPDAGRIDFAGRPYRPDSPLQARDIGVAMIYQELTLAPHLSVEENLVLGAEPARFGWIDRRRRRERARRALATVNHSELPLDVAVHRLSIAQQQVVEIARACLQDARLFIMDEPTSSLSRIDVANLFTLVRQLRERGVSVIYISHFLEECIEICDRYTVLRDGRSVGLGNIWPGSMDHIVRLMVGGDAKDAFQRGHSSLGKTVLELKDLSGLRKPRSVSFSLREGEILGVAGLVGAGRTETVRVCFGLDRLLSGAIYVLGSDRSFATPSERLNSGIGLLSENRKDEGLMLNRSVEENLTLSRLSPFSRGGFVDKHRQMEVANVLMGKLGIRARSSKQKVDELSGGNQQKVALGRLLHHDCKVLLLDEPTRGIDIASRTEIYRLIGELAASGKAILFISSYLPELLAVCDTIAVMSRGVISAVRRAQDWTEHDILMAAVGGK